MISTPREWRGAGNECVRLRVEARQIGVRMSRIEENEWRSR